MTLPRPFSPQSLRMTLRGKFLLIVLPLVCLSFIAFSLLLGHFTYKDMKNGLREDVNNFMEVQALVLAETFWNLNYTIITYQVESMLQFPWVARVQVRDVLDEFHAEAGVSMAQVDQQTYIRADKDLVFEDNFGPQILGELTIWASTDHIRTIMLHNLARDALLLFLLVLTFIISAMTANHLTVYKPLSRLMEAIQLADRQNVRTGADWKSHDEIGQVIAAYNALLKNLTIQEDALSASETRFKSLAQNMPGMVFQMVLTGTYDWVFPFVSPGAKKFFPHYQESMPAQNPFNGLGRDERQTFWAVVDLAMKSGTPVDQVIHIMSPSHEEMWLHLFLHAKLSPSEEVIVDGLVLDVTDKEQARRDLQKSKAELEAAVGDLNMHARKIELQNLELFKARHEADQASRAKSDFLANMSHEIRTPLNAVIGITELALDEPGSDSSRESFQTISREAEGLLDIINDVLDFSKIEAGLMYLDIEAFDLRHIMEQITSTMAVQAKMKGLKFIVSISPDVSTRLIGDPVRLRQILLNLIGNALKFTHQGEISTCISVHHAPEFQARTQQLDSSVQDQSSPEMPLPETRNIRLLFTVKDTGIGIPEKRQTDVFDSFTQVDGSMTRKHGGTGLGLAISKKFVEMMDGMIGVDSRPGEGSLFWFTAVFGIQANDISISDIQAYPDQNDLGKSGRKSIVHTDVRILLVEDYPTNQQVALRHLHRAGYAVDLAENGRQAVEAFLRNAYDLVLMDIQMPVMDGYEATRRIRAAEAKGLKPDVRGQVPAPQVSGLSPQPCRRIPIIAMTAHAIKGYREKCLDTGMDDYITKPVRRAELLAMVEKWTGAARYMDTVSNGSWAPQVGDAPVDYARALQEFENDEEFMRDVMRGFVLNVEKQLPVLGQALDDGDAETVAREAHAIKGGAANLTADDMAGIARLLEDMGKEGCLDKGRDTLASLEREHQRLKTYVEENGEYAC